PGPRAAVHGRGLEPPKGPAGLARAGAAAAVEGRGVDRIDIQPVDRLLSRLPSSSTEEGRGWWCAQRDEAKGSTLAPTPPACAISLSGHTTTQPSSVEEEGLRNRPRLVGR